MKAFSKKYTISVAGNPCFLNHKINNQYVLPLDGLFELLLIYLLNKNGLSFPVSFSELHIQHLLRAQTIHNEKYIILDHDFTMNKIMLSEISNTTFDVLSGFLSSNEIFEKIELSKSLSKKITFQEIYTPKNSEIYPFYHSVKEIVYDEKYASVIIQSSLPSEFKELFYNDVTILNGVVTALINFCMTTKKSDQLCLPYYFRKLTFFKKIEQKEYLLQIERKEHDSFSLRLLDKNNDLVLAADGVECKMLPSWSSSDVASVAESSAEPSLLEPIAIIGMAGRFPKSNNLEEFWQNLCNSYDGIDRIPAIRRNDFISNSKNLYEYGGFLVNIAEFDARFFDISGHEALAMEPQQRLFLEIAWEALEQAGYSNRKQLDCAVYLGITQGDYLPLMQNEEPLAQSFWGNAPSIAASRISYFLDLKGPAIAVDTACSSSLTALHMACDQLRNDSSELAIVGGVFLTLTDQFHQKALLAKMLSPQYQCHAFSEQANGFVPGEGVGAVILKKLSKAERDGDYIHAVVIGSGINQDGKTNGITAPNSEAQSALQKRVYDKYNINPQDIGYIEAHGTGTELGDPIEIDGLQKTFSAYTSKKQFCAIGSVKSNIGHSAAAAGMASLLKVCLSLKHHIIPASRHLTVTNSQIDFQETAFYPAKETSYWVSQHDRIASINSFGFSGTNAHAVVKEYIHKPKIIQDKKYYFLPFSAKDFNDLIGYLKGFNAWLIKNNEFDFNSICYTLSCCKIHFEKRFIIVASNRKDLLSSLENIIKLEALVLENLRYFICSSGLKENIFITDRITAFLARQKVNWLDLYDIHERYAVPLPTYYWKKNKFWPNSQIKVTNQFELKYFDLTSELEYIRDHVVNGSNILPAAAYIAFCYSSLNQKYTLQNIYFLQPCIVENEVKLSLEIHEGEKSFIFKVGETIYSQGTFSAVAAEDMDLNDVTKKYSHFISGKEAYDQLHKQGLSYGKSLKKIESINYDVYELMANIQFDTTPDLISVLDVALQATVVFNPEQNRYLPFSMNKISIYHIPQNKFQVFAKIISVNNNSIICNIIISDSTYNVCIHIEKFEARNSVQFKALSPKLYYRDVEKIKFAQNTSSAQQQNIILLNNTNFRESYWYESLGDLVKKIHVQNVEFDSYNPIDLNIHNYINLEDLNIYFVSTESLNPADLLPIKWVFNLLKFLLDSKIPCIRLFFIFSKKNSVQLSALEGLARSLKLETDKFLIHLIPANQTDDVSLILRQILLNQSITNSNNPLSYIKYKNIDHDKNKPVLKKQATYLITGGTGGIGVKLIEYLVEHYQATIIVLARKMQVNLRDNVQQYACDITNKDELICAFKIIMQNYPIINGVFHLAGVLNDKLFTNTSWNSFYQVISPKLLGVINLNELTKDIPLDFFCCFSSLSAYTGNAGQCAYSYANSFLDHYMYYRNQLGDGRKYFGFSQSISWPLWQDAGMGRDQEIKIAALKMWKLKAIDDATGFLLLEKSLNSKHLNTLVANDYLVSNDQYFCHNDTPQYSEVDLTKLFSEMLKISPEEIDFEKPFFEFGIDSLLAVAIIEKLSVFYGELPKSLLFELTNLAELIQYLDTKKTHITLPSPTVLSHAESALNVSDDLVNSIAIIGLDGKYPDADNLEIFWNNLNQNKLAISQLSKRTEHTWPYSWAGLVDKYDYFDPLFFGISPLDAIKMDPQERLFLQVAYHAFENAGYPKARLKNDKRVGVFVGVMYGLYQLNGVEKTTNDNKVIANSTYASVANRVSYCLDLHGPSMAIDSMCSSSLTAIHLGIQSLILRECNMVVCGGVNLITHPYKYAELLQKSFLAADGLCHSFANDGNGYVPGEGVGAVVLKRLNDAIRDNDRIYGVIRASAVNHGGFSSGYTVPNKIAQQRLLAETLEHSGLSAENIQYIEAHGTGTQLGDPIEFRALCEIYGDKASSEIYLGSVKANIGHLESAAGIASLTKILLQMKHNKIVPHLLHGMVNPNLMISETNFKFAQQSIPWESFNKNAAISSFGAGGSNSHLIVSNYNSETKLKTSLNGPYLLCISAHTSHVLMQKWKQLDIWISKQTDLDLADLSYTLAIARDHFNYKSILVCQNYNEMVNDIKCLIKGKYPNNYFDTPDKLELSELNNSIQEKILEYLNLKSPNLHKWFSAEKFNLLEAPLYPFDEQRYNLTNETEKTLSSFNKQRWIHTGYYDVEETRLIEHSLVICNSVCKIITQTINQNNCFILDLSKNNLTIQINAGIEWLRGLKYLRIIDLIGIEPSDKIIFEKQFGVYQQLLNALSDQPLCFYKFDFKGVEETFSENKACLNALYFVWQAEYSLSYFTNIEVDNVISLLNIFYFEQKNSDKPMNIKYVDKTRYIPKNYNVADDNYLYQKPLSPDSYYLVSGGSSGIGYLIAQHLVSLGAKKLILMGITPLPDEVHWNSTSKINKKQLSIIKNLSILREKGIEVKHVSLLLTDLTELTKALQPFIKNIRGIVHAAGITDFRLERFRDKVLDEFDKHFNVKYLGLNNLLSLTSIENLDFVFAFSSSSSANFKEARGISSYAFGNYVLDRYIEYLSSIYPGKFLSIRWPTWHESNAGALQTNSLKTLATPYAFSLFDRMLSSHRDGVIDIVDAPLAKAHSMDKENNSSQNIYDDSSISDWLKNYFINIMKIPAENIDINKSFIEYGIDSIILIDLIKALELFLGQAIPPAIILDNPSIRQLSLHFKDINVFNKNDNNNKISTYKEKGNDGLIAIIGLSGRFPGAENINQFWENLINGYCAINSVSSDRLNDIDAFEKAGFLNNIKSFDPHFFGFTESYAAQLDPLIRLSLELSIEAIFNAGYTREEFKKKNCAVLVAARAANYVDYIDVFGKDTISGIGQNFLAAQVSQYFDLSGPSYVIDSACSSSLSAIYLACQHLKNNDVDYALVNGVELLLDNRPFELLRVAGALSPSQTCQPFSQSADGILLGEGGGALILKRLKDALRDGDKIEAIIAGGAMNNDGQTMGITTPNPHSQSVVVNNALINAGVQPEDISYIEAHATGTSIGDPMEMDALSKVFPTNKKLAYCAVGSVKSNIGHLLSAAGMASIIKIILAMKHKQIPKSLGCELPNKRFKFEESPFYLLKDNLIWPSHYARYAGVSGFGFGGTNVHLILSDFDQKRDDYSFVQKRFEYDAPNYNRKNIWPLIKFKHKKNIEPMDLFFEITEV